MRMFAAVAALAAVAPGLPAQEAGALATEQIREDVYLIRGAPHGNVLVSRAADGVLLVDAQSAELADRLAETVAGLGGPVRYVVNTHYHEDHIGGNPRFRAQGALTLAHANVPAQARRDTVIEELEWHREAAPGEAIPERTVASDSTFAVGGATVEILHVPQAHTDGDVMVWLPDANVLHMGDVFELGAYPFIDWPAGGSIAGMIDAVDRALALVNDDTAIVPGHGPVADRRVLREYRAMLVAVADGVRDALRRGLSMEAAMDLGLTREYDADRRGSRAGRRFVGVVYLSLGGAP